MVDIASLAYVCHNATNDSAPSCINFEESSSVVAFFIASCISFNLVVKSDSNDAKSPFINWLIASAIIILLLNIEFAVLVPILVTLLSDAINACDRFATLNPKSENTPAKISSIESSKSSISSRNDSISSSVFSINASCFSCASSISFLALKKPNTPPATAAIIFPVRTPAVAAASAAETALATLTLPSLILICSALSFISFNFSSFSAVIARWLFADTILLDTFVANFCFLSSTNCSLLISTNSSIFSASSSNSSAISSSPSVIIDANKLATSAANSLVYEITATALEAFSTNPPSFIAPLLTPSFIKSIDSINDLDEVYILDPASSIYPVILDISPSADCKSLLISDISEVISSTNFDLICLISFSNLFASINPNNFLRVAKNSVSALSTSFIADVCSLVAFFLKSDCSSESSVSSPIAIPSLFNKALYEFVISFLASSNSFLFSANSTSVKPFIESISLSNKSFNCSIYTALTSASVEPDNDKFSISLIEVLLLLLLGKSCLNLSSKLSDK